MHWHMQGGCPLITTPSALLGASKQEKDSQAAVVPSSRQSTACSDSPPGCGDFQLLPRVMPRGSRMGLCMGSQEITEGIRGAPADGEQDSWSSSQSQEAAEHPQRGCVTPRAQQPSCSHPSCGILAVQGTHHTSSSWGMEFGASRNGNLCPQDTSGSRSLPKGPRLGRQESCTPLHMDKGWGWAANTRQHSSGIPYVKARKKKKKKESHSKKKKINVFVMGWEKAQPVSHSPAPSAVAFGHCILKASRQTAQQNISHQRRACAGP